MEHNRYLSAGEFAAVAGTTKHTLFYYDEIGLFTPQRRAENGYRYYSVDQLEAFDVICTLRELDMPLTEIQEYLRHKSPDNFKRLLDREKELAEEKIVRLRRMRRWLEEKSGQLALDADRDFSRVEEAEFPVRYLVCSYSELAEDLEMASKINELYEACRKYGYKSAFNVGYIQRYETLSKGIYDDYHTFYLLFGKPPRRMEYRVKPAGRYLCAYHRGHWKNIGEAYERLFSFAEDNKLRLGEEFYEDYLLDALTVDRVEDYVTRIAVRVTGGMISGQERKREEPV